MEEALAKEVKEKQDLVTALGKEKHSLTKKLRRMVRDIRDKKHQIRKQIKSQTETAFMPPESAVLPRYRFSKRNAR